MSDANKPVNQTPEKKEDIQIEPLSDKVLEDVSGGASGALLCPLASCSDVACSG
jgi:hypothetical protein